MEQHRNFTTQSLAALVVLGFLSMGVTTTASATAMSEADASLSVTLTDVGGAETVDYAIMATGTDAGLGTDVGGDGAATAAQALATAMMELGDTVVQTSDSEASATTGFAGAFSPTNLDIGIEVLGAQPLLFVFEWEVTLDSAASGDADALNPTEAFASVDVFSPGGAEFLESFSDLSGSDGQVVDSGTLFVQVAPGPGNTQFVTFFLDTGAQATSDAGQPGVAPEPTTLALLGLGLAGIGYRRRLKISKKSGGLQPDTVS